MTLSHPRSKLRPLRDLVFQARAEDGFMEPRPSWFSAWLNRIEEAALAPRAFTAVLRVQPVADLLERVRVLASDASLLAVPGVRGVRFSLREDALLFTCVHEGEREDVLYELVDACGPALDAVLQHCPDYPGYRLADACVRMLLAAAVDRKLPRSRPLRREYDRIPGLHAFERAIPDEAYWIGRCARLMRASSRHATRQARRKNPSAVALRGIHAKHHGYVRAQFVVHGAVPADLQRGVFKPGQRYDAWLRLSNMSGERKPDRTGDARGLAIKLDGVPGVDCQDFLLASHPVFVVKDVRDYTVLQSLVAPRGPALAKALRKLVFLARRPKELLILKRARSLVPDHPLSILYHSMSAYALGGARVVKYLVRPLPPVPKGVAAHTDDDLRLNLRLSLDPATSRGLRLEFCLVVPAEGRLLSVEDACADWSKHSEIIPVATIEIEAQDPSSPERLQLAEKVVFSVEHSLPDHVPLGSLSRARKAVYRESASHRAAANA